MEETTRITSSDSRTIVAVFEGPAVARGRVSVPEFVRVLDGIQRSLVIVGQDLMGRQRTRGPVPQTYTEQLTLELVATEPGSFTATLALPEPRTPALIDLGEEALDKVLEGIEAEFKKSVAPVLSEAARAVVRETILKAVGRDTRLTIRGGKARREIVISEDAVNQAQAFVAEMPRPRGRTQLVGRLLEIDFKDHTAEVWDASGRMTRVRFDEELADVLKAAARMQVVVEGDAEVDDRGRARGFEIEGVNTLDIPDEFWKNPTLDELIREQGIQPIRSIQDLAVPSFADEDVESLLSELRNLLAP